MTNDELIACMMLPSFVLMGLGWFLLQRFEKMEGRIRACEERCRAAHLDSSPKNSNWQTKTPHRSCGCACHGARP